VPATDRINPSALIAAPWWAVIVGVFGLGLALTSRDLVGLVGGAVCLTPYAHAYDLVPLTPLAASWLFERKAHGWGLAIAGGALLGGLVATPAAALAFFGAVAALRSRIGGRTILGGMAPVATTTLSPSASNQDA
jgi:hypothetical protein